ncbi:MAG: tetratricopeptide repeat protein [Actinomycetes bacterium]|jgi:putative thioredoxin
MSMPPLPKNLSRAIDLSGLASPKSAQNQGPAITVTSDNLVKDFLAASNKAVVIILCWSPRSAQSQQVLDMLSKFYVADSAKTGQAPWIFGSVNVDAEPAVAQAVQVQSVPLAIAIIQEQVVPLFESIPTESQVRLVIDKVLTLAAERGIGVAPAPSEPVEPALEAEEEAALSALEAGDFVAAKAAYQAWLTKSPFEPMAKLGLAQTELFIRTQGATLEAAAAAAALNPTDIAAAFLAADMEIMHGLNKEAFDRLISLVKATSGDDRKAVREHLLTLFSIIDPEDPVLVKARQALASALF